MVFVDRSAVIAMLAGEPDAPTFADKLAANRQRISAGHVIVESWMRLADLLDVTPTAAVVLVTRLLREARSKNVPINASRARRRCRV